MPAKMKFNRKDVEPDVLRSVPEISKILDLSQNTVRTLIKRGDLASYKILGNYKIKQSDLDDFLQRHST